MMPLFTKAFTCFGLVLLLVEVPVYLSRLLSLHGLLSSIYVKNVLGAHRGLAESEVDNSPLGATQDSDLCILVCDKMNSVWAPA